MTGEEVRKMTDAELPLEIKRLQERSYTLRSQQVTSKIDNTMEFGNVRKDIARLLTEQSARRIKAAPAKAPRQEPPAAKTKVIKNKGPMAAITKRNKGKTFVSPKRVAGRAS